MTDGKSSCFFFFLSKISFCTFYCLPQPLPTLIRMKAKRSLRFISYNLPQMTVTCAQEIFGLSEQIISQKAFTIV